VVQIGTVTRTVGSKVGHGWNKGCSRPVLAGGAVRPTASRESTVPPGMPCIRHLRDIMLSGDFKVVGLEGTLA